MEDKAIVMMVVYEGYSASHKIQIVYVTFGRIPIFFRSAQLHSVSISYLGPNLIC